MLPLVTSMRRVGRGLRREGAAAAAAVLSLSSFLSLSFAMSSFSTLDVACSR